MFVFDSIVLSQTQAERSGTREELRERLAQLEARGATRIIFGTSVYDVERELRAYIFGTSGYDVERELRAYAEVAGLR